MRGRADVRSVVVLRKSVQMPMSRAANPGRPGSGAATRRSALGTVRFQRMDEHDEAFAETFSRAAREAYTRRAEELIAEIRRHVEWTLQRDRPGQDRAFDESAKRLQAAADAFNSAEIGWSDSVPFNLDYEEDEADDGDWDDDEPDEEDDTAAAGNLTVVGRWYFRITDPEAVVAAGRDAYLSAWPDDMEDDAERRVRNVVDAAMEIEHARGVEGFALIPGLEPAPNSYQIGFGVYSEEEDVKAVTVELDDDERMMLIYGLRDWDGPGYATDSLALAMGFSSASHLLDEAARIARAITDGQALSVRDWTRALIATEFAYTSAVLGAGNEWTTIHAGSDEHWINVLRRLQHKVPHAARHLAP